MILTLLFFLTGNHLKHIGSYTSGHFIWNLWNEPSASFINFIWNDHECKILFIIWPFKCDLIAHKINIISARKRIVDTDVVNDVTSTRQSVITRVFRRFVWHDVIHWITATPYDKVFYWILKYFLKLDWLVGHLFWSVDCLKPPFETVFQSISGRLPERGR